MIDEKSCGCIIVNENKVLLIQHNEGHWDFPKGHVEENETEVETAIREVKEETNLDVEVYEDKKYISEYYTNKGKFKQVVYFLANSINTELKMQEEEIQNIEWISFEEAINKITYDNSREILRQVIRDINPDKKIDSYKYIGQKIQVKIDRALGTKHPKHGFEYLVNYGYVPNTVSGDGEELDCYVLGVDYPLDTFEGKCIAIIHRTNDDDDKLIIVPEGMEFTDEEIRKQTNFQEQYFESEIIR